MSSNQPAFRSGKQRAIFKAAVAAGWTWRVNGGGHVVVTSPEGVSFSLSTTAKDEPRSYRNNRAAARRAGLDI